MILIEGATVTYPGHDQPALLDISTTVPAGSFRWVLGASGSGKTTLLRLLALGLKPAAGRLELFGVSVRHAPRSALARLRRRTGTVFQDPRLLSDLSVFDNVALPLRLDRTPEAQVDREVTEMLRWMGLGRKSERSPADLSAGERHRVAVARAVVHRPRLLLADEPLSVLDEPRGTGILELLTDLNRLGSTVLVATSSRALVDRFPHATLQLDRGRLLPP